MEIVFTNHAEERLKVRRFTKYEIIEAIKNPDNISKKHNKYCYQKRLNKGKVEIICEKTERVIKVITLYWL